MSPERILFYLFSFGALASALCVVTTRSAVYGVLSLVGTMCMLAGLFVLLKAFFVATVLVLVYAGAILVLFLFVVMFVDPRSASGDAFSLKLSPVLALALSALLFAMFCRVIGRIGPVEAKTVHGTAQAVGGLLFSRHVLAFELTSFLVLAAVVSVVVLAKRDEA